MRFPYNIDGLDRLPVHQTPNRVLDLGDASLAARTDLSLQDSTAFFGVALELRDLVAELRDVDKAIAKPESFRVEAGRRTPAERLGSLAAAMRSWARCVASTAVLRETWASAVAHHSFSYKGTPREPVGDQGRWTLGDVTKLEARPLTGPLAAVLKPARLETFMDAFAARFDSIFLNPDAGLTSRGDTLAPLLAALPQLAEAVSGSADAKDKDPTFLGQSVHINLENEETRGLNERLARALGLPLELVSSVREVRAACGGIVDVPQSDWKRGLLFAQGRRLPENILAGLTPPNLERLESIQADLDRADALYRGELLLVHVEELRRATAGLAVSDRFAARTDGVLGLIGFDLGALGDLARSTDERVRLAAKTALESAGRVASEDPKLMEILGPDGGQNKAFGLLISHSPLGLLEDGQD